MKKTIKAQTGVVVIEVTDDDGKPLYWEVWKDGALIGTYDSEDEALVVYHDLIDGNDDGDDEQPTLPQEKYDTDDTASDEPSSPDPFRPS